VSGAPTLSWLVPIDNNTSQAVLENGVPDPGHRFHNNLLPSAVYLVHLGYWWRLLSEQTEGPQSQQLRYQRCNLQPPNRNIELAFLAAAVPFLHSQIRYLQHLSGVHAMKHPHYDHKFCHCM
jgi:hypothetical protein